jgi:hypothetical protein
LIFRAFGLRTVYLEVMRVWGVLVDACGAKKWMNYCGGTGFEQQ